MNTPDNNPPATDIATLVEIAGRLYCVGAGPDLWADVFSRAQLEALLGYMRDRYSDFLNGGDCPPGWDDEIVDGIGYPDEIGAYFARLEAGEDVPTAEEPRRWEVGR